MTSSPLPEDFFYPTSCSKNRRTASRPMQQLLVCHLVGIRRAVYTLQLLRRATAKPWCRLLAVVRLASFSPQKGEDDGANASHRRQRTKDLETVLCEGGGSVRGRPMLPSWLLRSGDSWRRSAMGVPDWAKAVFSFGCGSRLRSVPRRLPGLPQRFGRPASSRRACPGPAESAATTWRDSLHASPTQPALSHRCREEANDI